MFSIHDHLLYFYEKVTQKNPFYELDKKLRNFALEVRVENYKNPDFTLYRYILEKSIFRGVRESIHVCLNDDGSLEYINFSTAHRDKITKTQLLIESSSLFKFHSDNPKHILYSTPISRLYLSVMLNPYGNAMYIIRLMYGDIKT